jgi:hypothetical protein
VGSGFFIQKWLDGNHEKTIPLILASSFLYSVTPAMAASGNMTIEQRLAALEKASAKRKRNYSATRKRRISRRFILPRLFCACIGGGKYGESDPGSCTRSCAGSDSASAGRSTV